MNKKITTIVCVVLLLSVAMAAQTYTRKYNEYYQRTEYYDAHGKMIGYSKVNRYYNRTEYYDANGHLKRTEKYNDFYDRTETRDASVNLKAHVRTTSTMAVKKLAIQQVAL